MGCSTEPVDRIGTRPFDKDVTQHSINITAPKLESLVGSGMLKVLDSILGATNFRREGVSCVIEMTSRFFIASTLLPSLRITAGSR